MTIGKTERGVSSVLSFWFEELEPKQRWIVDQDLDHNIGERFGGLLKQASGCELFSWRQSPEGRLAEIIVLDQFSRNVFRGTPGAFSQDPLALVLAQEAVGLGLQEKIDQPFRSFMLMPYMHSESVLIHERALELFTAMGDEGTLRFEIRHKEIIDRFGRYPHRNDILGRESTDDEIEFLKQPGSKF